jgi:hypothetical protein
MICKGGAKISSATRDPEVCDCVSGDNKEGVNVVAQAKCGPKTSGLIRGENFIRKVCIVNVLFS